MNQFTSGTPELTARQTRELHTAVRHLGRALNSFSRAGLPDPPNDGKHGWLWDLHNAERQTGEASNKLIDGLEGYIRATTADHEPPTGMYLDEHLDVDREEQS